MRRPFPYAAAAAALLFSAGAAAAQGCLSISDGQGGVTLHCEDGRIGYMRVDPAGGAAGMLGSQPYAGSASALALPPGPPAGYPSAAYIPPPLPPPLPPLAPVAPPDPSPATALPSLSPPPVRAGLTPLQRQYLQDRLARADREKALAQGKAENQEGKAKGAEPASGR